MAQKLQPKLLHRMAAEGFGSRLYDEDEFARSGAHYLRTSPILVVDDAADMFIRRWKDGVVRHVDIQNAAPPFPVYWMEYQLKPKWRIGAIFKSERLDDGGWGVSAFVAAGHDGERVRFPWFINQYAVNSDGTIDPEEFGCVFDDAMNSALDQMPSPSDGAFLSSMFTREIMAPLYAVHGFINCRNVELERSRIDESLGRRMLKRFGDRDGGYEFRTIVIRSPGSTKPLHVASQSSGVMPLHVCRGHYKRYGDEYGTKPLFGRYSGVFWFPSHTRGHAKNGVVDKDYVVGVNKDESGIAKYAEKGGPYGQA